MKVLSLISYFTVCDVCLYVQVIYTSCWSVYLLGLLIYICFFCVMEHEYSGVLLVSESMSFFSGWFHLCLPSLYRSARFTDVCHHFWLCTWVSRWKWIHRVCVANAFTCFPSSWPHLLHIWFSVSLISSLMALWMQKGNWELGVPSLTIFPWSLRIRWPWGYWNFERL